MWLDRWKGYRYENTREYLRLEAAWPLKCDSRLGPGAPLVTTAKDVGAGGIGVLLRERLPAGSSLHVELHVPPLNRTICAEGKIVRVADRKENTEYGIRLFEMDPTDRLALNEVVEQAYTDRERQRQRQSWWRKI